MLDAPLLALAILAAPPLPPEMARTWAAFQEALRQDSPESLARITRFPLRSNEFGTLKGPEALKGKYKAIFTAKRKKCLLAANPSRETLKRQVWFEAFCDNDRIPLRFIFEARGRAYAFVSIDNINE
ncbi:MAG: hypothetical protein HY823_05340 [Acidobacteria bacterium]|nr:hypothetical protein [Acidobacteriota bacterium]